MDMNIDRMMLNAAELKKGLQLNSNQLILWSQTEVKLNTIRQSRAIRRERLQSELSLLLERPRAELREMSKQIESEEQQGLRENAQIREIIFTFNDALDDQQRQVMQNFFAEQLLAQPESSHESKSDKTSVRNHAGGAGRQRGSMGSADGRF